MDDEKQRRTSTNEPAEGHHDAHEKPKAPYGSEAQDNAEQAKRRDDKREDGEPSQSPSR